MRSAGIAELKASLSGYLAAVKSGEEVVITERGHPIARIVPIPPHRTASHPIEELVRAGVLNRHRKTMERDFLRRSKPQDSRGAVLQALLRERREAR